MATVDDQPNVLLFLTDQQRPDWVGMHPEIPVRTPNIERLAERGVDFSNAVCPSPLCGPSRACLASGMEYENCGMQSHGGEPTFDRDRTLYSRLRDDAGYHVMGCGKVLDKFYGRRGPNGRHRIEEFGLSDGVRNRGKWASTNPVADNRDHVYRRALAEADRFEDHERDYNEGVGPAVRNSKGLLTAGEQNCQATDGGLHATGTSDGVQADAVAVAGRRRRRGVLAGPVGSAAAR